MATIRTHVRARCEENSIRTHVRSTARRLAGRSIATASFYVRVTVVELAARSAGWRSLEGRDQLLVQAGVCQHQDIVTWPQPGVRSDGQQLAVSHDEADPGFPGQVGEVADGAPVGGRAGPDRKAVHACGLVSQPDPERPWFRLDSSHLDA